MVYITESTQETIVESLEIPKFTIENIANVQSLSQGIRIKFTSQSSPDSTIFKWKFGDETDPYQYIETSDRSIIHEYENPNTYTVKHQACSSDLSCCYNNDIPWCITSITVNIPPPETFSFGPLLGFGLILGLFLSKECGDRKSKNDCEKHDCKWIDTKKRCIKKEKITTIPLAKPPTKEKKATSIYKELKPKQFTNEEEYLIAKLRERGIVGKPICKEGSCQIGHWIAINRKGKEPIIKDP